MTVRCFRLLAGRLNVRDVDVVVVNEMRTGFFLSFSGRRSTGNDVAEADWLTCLSVSRQSVPVDGRYKHFDRVAIICSINLKAIRDLTETGVYLTEIELKLSVRLLKTGNFYTTTMNC